MSTGRRGVSDYGWDEGPDGQPSGALTRAMGDEGEEPFMRSAVEDPYRFAARLNSFKSVADGLGTPALLRAAARVRGLTAVELNYPQHAIGLSHDHLREAISASGLTPTALNLRYEGGEFARGAFTSPDGTVRERAVSIAQEAVERAVALGAGHVILWMANDGFDYPFQVDYPRLWADEVDGFRRVAGHDPSIRVSVEYKPVDPRRYALIRSMADALLAVRDVNLPNFGVTLDFCHSLMAGEHPPAAAALALSMGKLFGVHLNDGYGPADDGLAVGSIHWSTTLELLAYLRRFNYDGTIYFDTFPVREDPVAECEANIETVLQLVATLDRLDEAQLAEGQAEHDALRSQRLVRRAGTLRGGA